MNWLYAILAASVLYNVFAAVFAIVNREIIEEVKATRRARFSNIQIAAMFIAGFFVPIGWLLYSLSTDEWLFFIIACVPGVIGSIVRLSNPRKHNPATSRLTVD